METNRKCDAGLGREEIKEVYDSLAGSYDFWERFTESKAHNRSLEMAGTRDGESVLDAGVGTSLIFRKIAERNPGVAAGPLVWQASLRQMGSG